MRTGPEEKLSLGLGNGMTEFTVDVFRETREYAETLDWNMEH